MTDETRRTDQLYVGDYVRDRDADETDDTTTMLVVGLTGERADEVTFDGETTVASVNEEYPADDPVIEVVFTKRRLVDIDDVGRYSYPRSRLTRVASPHDLGDDTDDETDDETDDDAETDDVIEDLLADLAAEVEVS